MVQKLQVLGAVGQRVVPVGDVLVDWGIQCRTGFEDATDFCLDRHDLVRYLDLQMREYRYVYTLGTLRRYMLGGPDPFEALLEDVLEKIQNMLHDLIVNLTEDGYLGR